MNDFYRRVASMVLQGQDPMPILQEEAKTNPQIAEVLQMGQQGSLQDAAQVIAQRKGINLNGFVSSFLQNIGFRR